MQTKLYRLETYGMKSISQKIVINFLPQTSTKSKLKKDVSKIKAIYGSNGAGKTAIVQSAYFYKGILTDYDYLKQKNVIDKLNNLINKATKEFYISMIFGCTNEDLPTTIYKHELLLSYDETDQKIYIRKEKLSLLKDQTINGDYSVVFETNNGELNIYENKKDTFVKIVLSKTTNLLKSTSLVSMIYSKDILDETIKMLDKYDEKTNKFSSKLLTSLLDSYFFANNMTVYLNKEDFNHSYSAYNIPELIEQLQQNRKFFENKISSDEDLIPISKFDSYEKQINKLEKFIKIFKPDLNKIRIETKEDGELLHCRKIMDYSNFEISTEFESTGIRKLMKIYTFIENSVEGKIVFIDELDANISSIYLNKLLEYIQEDGKGQLCFTTHNILPMNYLYQLSQSLDFIGETGKIVSWKKNGNYKPYNLYPDGMIEDSPFNVEYYDFISVFETEGDK